MSKLCNVDKMYGKDLNILVTNAPSNIVKKYSKQFIKNALLISSNNSSEIENEYEDDGFPSLFAMDYEGNAVQLTYAIGQGNGLYVNEDDKLEMNVDKLTIREKNSKLYVDTNSLNKCNTGELGIVKVEDKIEKEQDSTNEYEIPDSTYISVNNSGTLYLANDFYNYMWKYVQEEIIKAIQPLIPKNYFGYLIQYNSFSNLSNVENNNNQYEYIYESNTLKIDSNGKIYGFGFYYTSGENVNSFINLKIDTGIKSVFNSPSMKVSIYANYYNVITYGHQLQVPNSSDSNPNNVPFQLIFPPNFYRSGNNFVNKEYRLEVSINGESENSEWNTRRLYFNLLQLAGNYLIEPNNPQVEIQAIDKGSDIYFTFNTYDFPEENIDNSIKNLIKYNISLIWDKTGENVELWSSGDAGYNLNIGNSSFTITWNTKEKEILKEKLNPTPGEDGNGSDTASFKINELYKSKQYTLRVSVLNVLNNSEISQWDTDFSVTYMTNIETANSRGIVNSLYLSEACIGNDDSYVVYNVDSSNGNNIDLDWIYSNQEGSGLRKGKRSSGSYHEEKIDRINSLFTRKDNDLMTLLFEFKYKDDDINELNEDLYDLLFNEDSFTIKLELLQYSDNTVTIINNDSENNLSYTKSAKNPNDKILLNFETTEDNIKNKNIKITFKKLIRPSLFINCIKHEFANEQYYNYVYMKIIVDNYYMNAQEFTVKVNVDSLVMNTIPYTFEDSTIDNGETYYINTGIMHLYDDILNISGLISFDNYSLKFTEEGSSDIELENNNTRLIFNNILDHNESGNEYKILLTINNLLNVPVYKKYIYFLSNQIVAEFPGFIPEFNNVTKKYHYIYISTLNNIYSDPNNYDILRNFDEKEIVIKKTGNNDWSTNNNDDFDGYLNANIRYNIDNNQVTFIDNYNMIWSCILNNKYIIYSGNIPLLTVSIDMIEDEYGHIAINNVEIDRKDNYTNHYSNYYYNNNTNNIPDILYSRILDNIATENIPVEKLINISKGYDRGADSYDTGQGAASQQEVGSTSYDNESMSFTLNAKVIVTPSEALKSWLYQAYYENTWYGVDLSYNDTNNANLKTLIKNIFDDLLTDVINSNNLQEIIDIDNLKNNIEIISTNNNKINFETYNNYIISCKINDYDTIYINADANQNSVATQISYKYYTNGTIEIDENYDSNGQNKLTAYRCNISSSSNLGLININDIFVQSNNIIYSDFCNKLYWDGYPLSDYLYYFDYETLYSSSNKYIYNFTWNTENIIYNMSTGTYTNADNESISLPELTVGDPTDAVINFEISGIGNTITAERTTNGYSISINWNSDNLYNENTYIVTARADETETRLPTERTFDIIIWDGVDGSLDIDDETELFGVLVNANQQMEIKYGGKSTNPTIINDNYTDLYIWNPYGLTFLNTDDANYTKITAYPYDKFTVDDPNKKFRFFAQIKKGPYSSNNDARKSRYFKISSSQYSQG